MRGLQIPTSFLVRNSTTYLKSPSKGFLLQEYAVTLWYKGVNSQTWLKKYSRNSWLQYQKKVVSIVDFILSGENFVFTTRALLNKWLCLNLNIFVQLFTQTTQTIPSNMLIPNEPRLWDVPLHHWILCSSEVEYQIAKSEGLTILVETQIFPSTQVHRGNDMFHSLTDLKFTVSFNRLMYPIRETSRRTKYTITEFKYH